MAHERTTKQSRGVQYHHAGTSTSFENPSDNSLLQVPTVHISLSTFIKTDQVNSRIISTRLYGIGSSTHPYTITAHIAKYSRSMTEAP
jgi:hypothetical protein